jgi:SET domain-containing protein
MGVQMNSEATQDAEGCQTEWLEFRSSAIHGRGGFAAREIKRGTRVIEYVGEIIDKGESLKRCEANNEFIFTLDEGSDVDGSVAWNPARFVNHSCEPNCEAEVEDGHIWIVALRDIAAGEEVTFNYGFDLEDYRDYPCRCGARECVGYMIAEEFFEHVRQQRALSSERED